jgi:hypothetical protein
VAPSARPAATEHHDAAPTPTTTADGAPTDTVDGPPSGRARREAERAARLAAVETRRALKRAAAAAAGCGPCLHGVDYGWWGEIEPARTHCTGCHRSWRSHREAHCARCHRHFASDAAHQAHFRDGACQDPNTAARTDGSPRFAGETNRFGALWKLAYYGPAPDFSALRDRSVSPGADHNSG